MTIRRVLTGTRDDLLEELENERRDTLAAATEGKTLRARQVAEGRADGLAFAIALLSDWDETGDATFDADEKAVGKT
ncbi:MAG: hypothetical protein V4472_25570 [Pseudomonadota bacterium]